MHHPLGTRDTDGDSSPHRLKDLIVQALDENKADNIEVIDLGGNSSIADYMIVASGTSSRQVAALAHKLDEKLSPLGFPVLRVDGLPAADWVVADMGDVIVHLFRPEVREFYSIEKMWRTEMPTIPSTPRARRSSAHA